MESKYFEIRDRGTKIGVIAIQTTGQTVKELKFWRQLGFSVAGDTILLVKPGYEEAKYSPYHWDNTRTMRVAHDYIEQNYHKLDNYSVIDVQYILGEKDTIAKSEIWD